MSDDGVERMPGCSASGVRSAHAPFVDVADDVHELGAASVHEAHGRRGALPFQIKPVVKGMRVWGPAVTVRCPPGDNLWIHEAIYAAAPGSILVVDVGTGYEYGYWGEITTVAAKAVGVGGLVINGGVRDVLPIERSGFSVFSRTICLRGTVKDPRGAGAVNEPVRLGDVTVRPGDLVVGDDDGVVVVSAEEAATVVEAAQRREVAEKETMALVENGERTIDRIRARFA